MENKNKEATIFEQIQRMSFLEKIEILKELKDVEEEYNKIVELVQEIKKLPLYFKLGEISKSFSYFPYYFTIYCDGTVEFSWMGNGCIFNLDIENNKLYKTDDIVYILKNILRLLKDYVEIGE